MVPAVIDGRVVDGHLAAISVMDDGLLRGDGVFEVIRLYAGRPWALDEHLERMALSARNLRLSFSRAEVAGDIELLLTQAGSMDACLRVVATRGGRRLCFFEDLRPAPASVALATIEYAPPALMRAIKSLSYAVNMLAVRLAREKNADDALFVTPHGRVLEASRASFFYVLQARLYTPPLEDHVLDSITRRHLMHLTDAAERVTIRDDLTDVSEAFVASTTKEVLPVRAIDGRDLPDVLGVLTRSAETALSNQIRATLGLTPPPPKGRIAEAG